MVIKRPEDGAAAITVKPPGSVPVPPGAVTETSHGPAVAAESMVMLAVIWVPPLSTVKLLALIPSPKLTAVAPSRLVPLMVTVRL